ncbi:hypothetical protein DPMN_034092 [Dreissena polymorpha]|uniref:Uncharacterized protein n=1 Tax=Dreissena polymorpha TaxID=45954 RepID=A0A9D4RLR8_DREPO|nr:hypothetical protein DPMN_034092 [Dreissena polymorpha]
MKMVFQYTARFTEIHYLHYRDYELVDQPYFKPGFITNLVVDNIKCTGTEKDYQMCQSLTWFSNSQCKKQAFLRCSK